MSIPQNLKTVREKLGITQTELGSLIGASRSMIQSYERGAAKPNSFYIAQIAAILGIEEEKITSEVLSFADVTIKRDLIDALLFRRDYFDLKEIMSNLEKLKHDLSKEPLDDEFESKMTKLNNDLTKASNLFTKAKNGMEEMFGEYFDDVIEGTVFDAVAVWNFIENQNKPTGKTSPEDISEFKKSRIAALESRKELESILNNETLEGFNLVVELYKLKVHHFTLEFEVKKDAKGDDLLKLNKTIERLKSKISKKQSELENVTASKNYSENKVFIRWMQGLLESVSIDNVSAGFREENKTVEEVSLNDKNFDQITNNGLLTPSSVGFAPGGNYKLFQVENDKMSPTLNKNDFVIAERVEERFAKTPFDYFMYVLVTEENATVARVFKKSENQWLLKLENLDKLVSIDPKIIKELWIVKKFLKLDMAAPLIFEIPKTE